MEVESQVFNPTYTEEKQMEIWAWGRNGRDRSTIIRQALTSGKWERKLISRKMIMRLAMILHLDKAALLSKWPQYTAKVRNMFW